MELSRTEALFAVVVGTAASAASVHTLLSNMRFVESASKTRGRVTQNVYIPGGGDMGGSYAPRFEFTTQDGKSLSVLSGTGSMPAAFKVGQMVTVLYSADDPAKAEIDSVTQLWYVMGNHQPISGVLFAMIAGKNYAPLIWKMIRPRGDEEKTFKVDEE